MKPEAVEWNQRLRDFNSMGLPEPCTLIKSTRYIAEASDKLCVSGLLAGVVRNFVETHLSGGSAEGLHFSRGRFAPWCALSSAFSG